MSRIRVHQFGGVDVLKFESNLHGIPAALHNTFLVQIKNAGVNPVDTYIRAGAYTKLPQLPYTPGFDFSGVIVSISDTFAEVYDNKFKVGTRVFGCLCKGDAAYLASCKLSEKAGRIADELHKNRDFLDFHGSYSQYCFVNPAVDIIDVLPGNVDFEGGAAATTTYLTAYKSLFIKGQCRPNQTILVHGGSGGVGNAAIEMAKNLGIRCIATAGTDAGLQICREAGAQHVFNHSQFGYVETILDLTEGVGVDLIIENAADKNLQKDLDVLKRNGKIVVVGCRANVLINPRVLMDRETQILGVTIHNSTRAELLEAQAYITAGLKSGAFNPVIQTFHLSETELAHREIIKPSSGGSAGRILLQIPET